jgi:CRP/FNR family nitrogen fixation transcriptional regulator
MSRVSPQSEVSKAREAANRLQKGSQNALTEAIDLMGAPINYGRDNEIFGEGETAEYVYKIVRGAVRTHKLLSDGRRQISGFYLPGDVFGLEVDNEHRLTAEALCDSTILVVKRSAVIALAGRQSEVARELWALAARELARVQNLMLTLGRKTAQERVAAFLLEMMARCRGKESIDLPMSRQDIADYLGLTIETISRTLTQLENAAAIALPSSRHIVLRNHSLLSQMDS